MVMHPLFPKDGARVEDEADDEPEIGTIRVYRYEDNGRLTLCGPTVHRPDALTSEAQIHELYGGGRYQLIAKDAADRYIVRKNMDVSLPGPPKDGATPGNVTHEVAPQAAPTPPAGAFGHSIASVLGQVAAIAAPLMPLFLGMLELVKQSRNAEREMLFATLNRQAPPPPAPTTDPLVGGVLTTLLGIIGQRPQGPDSSAAYQAGIEQGVQLAHAAAGAAKTPAGGPGAPPATAEEGIIQGVLNAFMQASQTQQMAIVAAMQNGGQLPPNLVQALGGPQAVAAAAQSPQVAAMLAQAQALAAQAQAQHDGGNAPSNVIPFPGRHQGPDAPLVV